MKNHLLPSLKSRMIVTFVTFFLCLFLLITINARKNIREDVLALSSHQLSSATEVAASRLNHDFDDRLEGLEIAAKIITQPLIDNPTLLQEVLEHQPAASLLFNDGLYIVKPDGSIITDQLHRKKKFNDQTSINAVLSGQVESIVGPLMQVEGHQAPLFLMVKAISDVQGKVIGAVVGATSLAKDNFIDKITDYKYGNTGGFIIVDPKHRMIVSATDKSSVMQDAPTIRRIPANDQSLAVNESPSVFVNPKGVEVLESSKSIPSAGWRLIVAMPTDEIYGPIRALSNVRFTFILLLGLITSSLLIWQILTRLLTPITKAAKTISDWTKHPEQFAKHNLVVGQHDEVGTLIEAFNQLLISNRDKEERLSLATNSAGVGVWDLNLQTMKLTWNHTMFELFDIRQEDFTSTVDDWRNSIHPEDKQYSEKELDDSINNGTPLDLDFRIVCKNGKIRYIKGAGKVFYNDSGTAIRVLGVNMDITQRILVDKMKSEFVSTAAHELRTPLTVINGYTELLKMGIGDMESQQEMLGSIHQQTQAMIHLLNDMLDVARIEAQVAGSYEMKLQPIGHRLQTLTETFIWPDNHNKVTLVLSPNLPEVNVDITKLEQAIKNCLSNAYKYSPEHGEVTMRVNEVMHDQQRKLLIAIEDHGMGMTPEQLERVFEKFYRANPSGAIPGTGLGMAIIKSIIEQHGGTIEIESEYGEGTKVMMYLPVAS